MAARGVGFCYHRWQIFEQLSGVHYGALEV